VIAYQAPGLNPTAFDLARMLSKYFIYFFIRLIAFANKIPIVPIDPANKNGKLSITKTKPPKPTSPQLEGIFIMIFKVWVFDKDWRCN